MQCLYLVKNGIPYDIAMNLDAVERDAFMIIFGTLDGSEFDWRSAKWKERNK